MIISSLRSFSGCLFVLHVGLALFAKWILGVSITAHPSYNNWDIMWQVIPVDLLQSNMLESIWHFHAQPPIFNLLCGILVKLSPLHHVELFHYFNILCGGAIAALTWVVLRSFIGTGYLSRVFGIVLALHPSLLLYEAFPTYDVFVTFLVLSTVVAFLAFFDQRDPSRALVFLSVLAILILSRSAFHLVLLIPAVLLVFLLVSSSTKIFVFQVVFICLPAVGWYSKNLFQYGFFGASSWFGMNLFRAAEVYYEVFPEDSLESMVHAGVLEPMVVQVERFSLPSEYRNHGYTQTSPWSVESRDDLNNINIPGISQVYGENAMRLIAHDPMAYLRGVALGYSRFSLPSYEFPDVGANRDRVAWLEVPYILLQENVFSWIYVGPYRFHTVFFLLLPLVILAWLGKLVWEGGLSPPRWRDCIEREGAWIWCLLLVTYVVVVFSFFEFGENHRFKFCVEHLIWVFTLGSICRVNRYIYSLKNC